MSSPLVPSLRLATVTALVAGPPPRVTIQVGGDTTAAVDAPYLDSYAPAADDVVQVLVVQGAPLVLGRAAAAGGSWTTLSLAAGWASWGGALAGQTSPAAAYSIVSGQVLFRGTVTNAGATPNSSPLVAALPAAARPADVKSFFLPEISTTAGAHVRLDVTTGGEMRVVFAQAAGKILSLDGLRWPLW